MEDYEKKYKEALSRAATELETCGADKSLRNMIYAIFPDELKESEDEKIRKMLIDSFTRADMGGEIYGKGVTYKQVIAWLEKQGESYTKKDVDDAYLKGISDAKNELGKQGEQKPAVTDFNAKDWYVSKVDGKIHDMTYNPADKVEPKFKIGDYIVSDYCMGRVIEITNDAYLLDTEQGIPFSCEHNVHLWTIQDAKDGDVLIDKNYMGESPFIFKETKPSNIKTDVPNPLTVLGYCGIGGAGFTKSSGWGDTANCIYYPATKEQRELLFKKMNEAGYEWDAEKKELKKIHVIDEGKAEMDYCFTKMMAGEKVSPAWSEEDENYLQSAENACEYQYGKNTSTILWLKSLKERNTWKPSKEQMEALDDALNERGFDYNDLNSLYEQLKKF